jgi:hypothetical protein
VRNSAHAHFVPEDVLLAASLHRELLSFADNG